MQVLTELFGLKDLIPHGYCLSWSPVLLWLNVGSDLLITLAYYSIPLMLVYFLRQRKDLAYPWLIALFAAFIVVCGSTHLLSAITVWIPIYWLDGWLKAFTALLSVATAVLMLRLIPKALSLPGTAQLQTEIRQRIAAETAQQEALDRLQKIAGQLPGMIFQCRLRTDGSACFPYASAAIRDIYRLSPEDVREDASKIYALLYPDDYRDILASIQVSVDDLSPWHYEYRVKFDDGTVRWLHCNALLQREADGSTLWHGFITDITERKQIDQERNEAQSRLQRIADAVPGIVYEYRLYPDGRRCFPYASAAIRDIYRLSPEDVREDASKAFALVHPDDFEGLWASVHKSAQNLSAWRHEYRLKFDDGTVRWLLGNALPQREADGAMLWHGFLTDITDHKLIEGAKEEALNRLQKIAGAVPGFVYQYRLRPDGSSCFPYASAGIHDIYRLSPEDVREDASKVFALVHLDDLDGVWASINESAQDLSPWHHEYRVKYADGAVRWMLGNALPERETDGSMLWHGFITDITERKHMEDELKVSEAKFRLIIEASPVPMALHDEQLNISYVNPAFEQTFGYSLDDIPTLADWRQKAHPDPGYRQWVKAAWQTTQEKAKLGRNDYPPLEMAVCCKNNNIKTVLATAAAISQDFSGLYLVMLYDITQRKQIEAKIDAIFNAAVEGIITFNLSDIIVSANSSVETIFGYQPEQLIGCSINKLLPSPPRAADDCSLLRAVKTGGQIREIEGLHKDGSLVPLDLSMAEYTIDNEQYFTYIVRDVRLRKHREQQGKKHLDQLAHVTRLGLMGEMASGIAHEVNQPLAAIASYAQVSLNLINTESPDLIKLAEVLDKTQQQALRAGRIIHRMREFVKSHAKHRSTVDVNTLIQDSADLCIADIKQNDIKLTFELENNLPMIYVDQIQIEQVIINLVRNSIDALLSLPVKQQRQLSIHSCKTLDNAIQVRVKDNGPGLGLDQQQNILMPFFTTKPNGMGMGLSISRSLIEAHEGILHFNSEPGKGSTFYFTLPSWTAESI